MGELEPRGTKTLAGWTRLAAFTAEHVLFQREGQRRWARLLGVLFALLGAWGAVAVTDVSRDDPPFIVVLGVAQDAGAPQAGCRGTCCAGRWSNERERRHVVCLGIVDPASGQRWMVEATPDFREQLRMLDGVHAAETAPGLDGILLTHGHIGHYTGLMFLGHESVGAQGVPVYGMPRMRTFLSSHGPWDQLVRYRNIELRPLEADVPAMLNDRLSAVPFRVPHREEYTEAVGFRIEGPDRTVLFIPDIDKWDRWDRRIEDVLADVDVAFLDGSFFADGELPGRDMSRIPHPFITETIERLRTLPATERAKVRFIHLNHTNPALRADSDATRAIRAAGFAVASEGARIPL